jgi:hypothetical protein
VGVTWLECLLYVQELSLVLSYNELVKQGDGFLSVYESSLEPKDSAWSLVAKCLLPERSLLYIGISPSNPPTLSFSFQQEETVVDAHGSGGTVSQYKFPLWSLAVVNVPTGKLLSLRTSQTF